MSDQQTVEQILREALTDPHRKWAVAEALGWDNSNINRFLNGGMGLVIDKIDAAMAAAGCNVVPHDGMVITADELRSLESLSRKYLELKARLREKGIEP